MVNTQPQPSKYRDRVGVKETTTPAANLDEMSGCKKHFYSLPFIPMLCQSHGYKSPRGLAVVDKV